MDKDWHAVSLAVAKDQHDFMTDPNSKYCDFIILPRFLYICVV